MPGHNVRTAGTSFSHQLVRDLVVEDFLLSFFAGSQMILRQQPIEHRLLVINRCPADLAKEMNAIRLRERGILQPFIAVRANGGAVQSTSCR
jgi:hypothetical protein